MTFATIKLGSPAGFAVGSLTRIAAGAVMVPTGAAGVDCSRLLKRLGAFHDIDALEAVYVATPGCGRRTAGCAAAKALLPAIEAWCDGQGVPMRVVGRQTYAQAFTGHSKATSAELLAEARRRDILVEDEASAEAVAIFHSVFAAA